MKKRSSGILHHITSLPSRFGVGDMGPEAYRFADVLSEARQSCWQVLPLNPTTLMYDSSPYKSVSSCAKNMLLISPEMLAEDGLLEHRELDGAPAFSPDAVDYAAVEEYKKSLFARAFRRFAASGPAGDFKRFCDEESGWLQDYALFVTLKNRFGGAAWSDWPAGYRDRDERTLASAARESAEGIEFVMFLQFVFSRQWSRLKSYCNRRGIQIIGDIPIYVEYDSVDVWKHPGLFKLDGQKKLSAVAGVPPDYFSQTGQLWGCPLYRWDEMQKQNFMWWIDRLNYTFRLYDMVRIDHFRGLVACWEIPASESTAINGAWADVPTDAFFNQLFKHFPNLPVIAEDLGTITADVREAIRRFGFPGMNVLQFAFGGDPANPYLPHNVVKDSLIYTGTHDNNTVRGWFEQESSPETRQQLFSYIGREATPAEVPLEMIRLAMMSVADMCIIPTQDILGLGSEARMNRPATSSGNWRWRMAPGLLTDTHVQRLRDMTELYGRA